MNIDGEMNIDEVKLKRAGHKYYAYNTIFVNSHTHLNKTLKGNLYIKQQ